MQIWITLTIGMDYSASCADMRRCRCAVVNQRASRSYTTNSLRSALGTERLLSSSPNHEDLQWHATNPEANRMVVLVFSLNIEADRTDHSMVFSCGSALKVSRTNFVIDLEPSIHSSTSSPHAELRDKLGFCATRVFQAVKSRSTNHIKCPAPLSYLKQIS
jgi:hypothetical protein